MRTSNTGVVSAPKPAVGVLTETVNIIHGTLTSLENVLSDVVNKLGIGAPGSTAGNSPSPTILDSASQAVSRAQNLLDQLISVNNVL